MPDVDERLDRVEQGLTTLGERMDEQFAKVNERFAQVDQRFAHVDQRSGSLEAEVSKLRLLAEENAAQLKQIAEVQVHHGEKLQQLVEAVEPLKDLRDFVERVAHDHERRITALEDSGRHTPGA